jgi:hypothetical protein
MTYRARHRRLNTMRENPKSTGMRYEMPTSPGYQSSSGVRRPSHGLLFAKNLEMSAVIGIVGNVGNSPPRKLSRPMPAAALTPIHHSRLVRSRASGSVNWRGRIVMGNGSCSSRDHRRRTTTLRQSVTHIRATAQQVHHMAGPAHALITARW